MVSHIKPEFRRELMQKITNVRRSTRNSDILDIADFLERRLVQDAADRAQATNGHIFLTPNLPYCVYAHSHKEQIFYVGMGLPSRPFLYTSRNQKWKEWADKGFHVAILSWHETAKDACEAELEAIQKFQPECNFKGTQVITEDVTFFPNKEVGGKPLECPICEARRIKQAARMKRWRAGKREKPKKRKRK